jgi:hypothetical protein
LRPLRRINNAEFIFLQRETNSKENANKSKSKKITKKNNNKTKQNKTMNMEIVTHFEAVKLGYHIVNL